ncbi:MAG: hypothetical protein XD93_0529 [candidate division WS6 bacterium 34_10]|uniref:Uncharacterized protein n=1 Tax=candidate division WS6 bacterium 34_10 TaxID=1641389 RepID=A0A101HHS3_9BACT|nr:MAG: hypothetical protein XD93_0529 [candidate division WS6 bacterium 34_10]
METNEIPINDVNIPNYEEIERKAYNSIRGTHIHFLTTVINLSQKTSLFNRTPNERDIRTTFPTIRYKPIFKETKQIDNAYCKALAFLFEEYQNPISVWENWKDNSITPINKNQSTKLDPAITEEIWKYGISKSDIHNLENNPNKTDFDVLEINEVLTILNLGLDRNVQIPSQVDTILIPKDPTKPIQIIDYKTGKEMDNIEYVNKVQAFLMSASIYYNMIDRRNKINWNLSEWDGTHTDKDIDLPNFKKKSLLHPMKFNCSIDGDILIEDLRQISQSIEFYYFNPINGKKIKVDYMSIAKNSLFKISELGDFYFYNRKKLKAKNHPNFLTPRFAPERVLQQDKFDNSMGYTGTQMSFI